MAPGSLHGRPRTQLPGASIQLRSRAASHPSKHCTLMALHRTALDPIGFVCPYKCQWAGLEDPVEPLHRKLMLPNTTSLAFPNCPNSQPCSPFQAFLPTRAGQCVCNVLLLFCYVSTQIDSQLSDAQPDGGVATKTLKNAFIDSLPSQQTGRRETHLATTSMLLENPASRYPQMEGRLRANDRVRLIDSFALGTRTLKSDRAKTLSP